MKICKVVTYIFDVEDTIFSKIMPTRPWFVWFFSQIKSKMINIDPPDLFVFKSI